MTADLDALLGIGKEFVEARRLRRSGRHAASIELYRSVLASLGRLGLDEQVDGACCRWDLALAYLATAQFDEALIDLTEATRILRGLDSEARGTLPGSDRDELLSMCDTYLEMLELGERDELWLLRDRARRH